MLGDSGVAEEITVEVFLRLWESAGSYRQERGKLSTWIIRITRNQAIDQLRKRERSGNPVRLQWEDTNPPVLEGNTPETATELSLLRQRVRTALNTLSVEQREPLLLAYFKGLSHRRITEELKLPLGTVKTRISLGMRKLAQLLKEENFSQ